MTAPSRAPRGLKAPGRRLWASVTNEYGLEEHEAQLLEQAARTADLVAALVAATSDGRLTEPAARGTKIRPEIVELRQQRIVLARLLSALRVPLGAEDDDSGHGPARLQRRSGTRGVYLVGEGS